MSKKSGSDRGNLTDIPADTDWLFYARDSGGAKQAASCDQQLTVGQEVLAKARARLARDPYVDRARRGSTTVGRADLERLLTEAQPGVAFGVMFWSSARMARDVDDAQYIRSTLRRRGYHLFYISDNIPNMGEWTPLFEVAQDIANQKRLQEISAEAKRGHNLAIAAGLIPSGMPPVGYVIESHVYRKDRDGKDRTAPKWVKDPAAAAKVRRAFEMRLEGYGLLAINAEVKLYADARHIGRMFRCTTYRGDVTFGERLLKGFVEPIVSAEMWEAVQQVTSARAAKHPRELAANKYLLTGLSYCGVCGMRMGSHMGHTIVENRNGGKRREYLYNHYRCTSVYHRDGFCGALMVRAEWAEARVIEALEVTYLNDERLGQQYARWETELAESGTSQNNVASLESEVADLQRRIAHLLDEVEKGASVGERLAQRETELAMKLESLKGLRARPVRQLAPPHQAQAMLETIKQAIAQGDRETARLFLAKMVLKIVLKKEAAPEVTLRAPLLS